MLLLLQVRDFTQPQLLLYLQRQYRQMSLRRVRVQVQVRNL